MLSYWFSTRIRRTSESCSMKYRQLIKEVTVIREERIRFLIRSCSVKGVLPKKAIMYLIRIHPSSEVSVHAYSVFAAQSKISLLSTVVMIFCLILTSCMRPVSLPMFLYSFDKASIVWSTIVTIYYSLRKSTSDN